MSMILENATLLTPTEVLEHVTVVISDEGKIANIGPDQAIGFPDMQVIDVSGSMVIPGLIDLHVHGGFGLTFGDGEAQSVLENYSRRVVSSGVTGFLCTLIAPDPGTLCKLIQAHVDIIEKGLPGAECLGLHLEGPFLNPEKKGAFNPSWLRLPNMEEARAFLKAGRGWIRQITMAPEMDDAARVASLFQKDGVVVALGHSNAAYELASNALQHPFTHVTHAFNAQRGFDHREPGVIGAVLASEQATAELIADLIHVHPAAIKVLVRCLGTDRVVLITDAMSGAGLPDGIYRLMGYRIMVRGGKATLEDGTLAGSTARLNQCVRNMHKEIGLPLGDAVKMASLNPARVINHHHRVGRIAVGMDANLVVIDQDVQVLMTIVRGKIIHNLLGEAQ